VTSHPIEELRLLLLEPEPGLRTRRYDVAPVGRPEAPEAGAPSETVCQPFCSASRASRSALSSAPSARPVGRQQPRSGERSPRPRHA
jgi:hypothetical protein